MKHKSSVEVHCSTEKNLLLKVSAFEKGKDSRILLDKERIGVDYKDIVPEDDALVGDRVIVGGDVNDLVRTERADANWLDALLGLLGL